MDRARSLTAIAAAALATLALAAPAGAAWTVVPGASLPNPGETTGVACVTSTACLLVGDQSGTTTMGLAFTWNGTTLRPVATASTTATPEKVSCASATSCMLIGADASGASVVPHAESWNGTAFSTTTMAIPTSGPRPEPWDVACPSLTSCWAAGNMTTASGHTLPFLERWNGSTWSLASLTLPAGTVDATLEGLSCASTTSCVAVGSYVTGTTVSGTLAVAYNGTSWSPQTTANPAGATSSRLLDVTCDSASRCMAVGSYDDAASVPHMLAETWGAGLWRIAGPLPDPWIGAAPVLDGVSCVVSPTYACEAVGFGTTASANTAPVAERWNGTSWALQSVAVPAGASDNALYDVSCPTSTACVAAGASQYTTMSGLQPWVELGP